MISDFKTVGLSWANKIAVVVCTYLFVYERAHSYEELMHIPSDLFATPLCAIRGRVYFTQRDEPSSDRMR